MISANISEIIKSSALKEDKLAQILKLIVDKCEIKPESYLILGSYALRKERTINDLDVNMDNFEFKKLKKVWAAEGGGIGKLELYNEQIRWFYDMTKEYQRVDPTATDFSIEIFQKCVDDGFPNSDFSLGHLRDTGGLDVDEYGHRYFSLETLLAWKQTMNREKDKPDIEIIERLLGTVKTGSGEFIFRWFLNMNSWFFIIILIAIMIIIFWDPIVESVAKVIGR